MLKLYKTIILITVIGLMSNLCNSQTLELSLKESISIAQKDSYDAFVAKYLYEVSNLTYKDYTNQFLPQAKLQFDPINYSRQITEVYNYEDLQFEQVQNQQLVSDASLNISQKVKYTGGNLTVRSSLERRENYKADQDNNLSYTAVPIEVYYSQSLSDFKKYKWQDKIKPLELNIAKREFAETQETIAIETVGHFFALYSAQVMLDLRKHNLANADTLLAMGEKRKVLGAIAQDDFLKLELKRVNAIVDLQEAENTFGNAKLDLCNYLKLPTDTNILCKIPNDVSLEFVNPEDAKRYASINNPDFLELKRKLLASEENLFQAKASRYDVDLSLSFGLNQNTDKISTSYEDLLDRQSVRLGMTLPILTWGETKRRIQKAELNKLITETQNAENEASLMVDVTKKVQQFNTQMASLNSVALADSISILASEATRQRFLLGNVSVVELNQSDTDLFNASINYINSLHAYWLQYYYMRRICLYDFEKKKSLFEM